MTTLSRRATLALLSASALTPAVGCASGAGRATGDNTAFAALSQKALDGIARYQPVYATQLGDHRFDAEIDDYSETGRRARAAFRRELLAGLEGNPAPLTRANQVDHSILLNQVRLDTWDEEVNQSWAWDPLPYNEVAGGALYSLMAREFAPLPERLNNATARMEKLPELFAQARANLFVERVPRIHAETLARQHRGLVSIVDDLILAQKAALGAGDRARLENAATTLKAAVDEHQTWIDTILVPGAQGDFRLGQRRYDQVLPLALNSPLTRQQIKALAEADIERITAEMAEIAGRIVTPPANERWTRQRLIAQALERAYAQRPSRNAVVEACEASLTETTAFVREHQILTLPDAPVRIILMPEFQQGVAVAYCDSPGPLDRGQSTFFAVSPVPADWSDEQATSFLKEYNSAGIHELTIHEAMPGHYAQLWHSNRYPSVLRAALYSGPFVEGWACYAQDVMQDEGFHRENPLQKLVNLKMALRVITNALLDQGVHVDGMEREEAMRLMTETAFQQEREAAGKWTRACVTSAQLPTYFVGWTEHHALRRETQQRWGSTFSLKRYHDAVLSFGSPPVRHARALLLDEPIQA